MRGKRESTNPHLLQGRLIPAYAGKTARSASSPGTCEAHPRVCGENASDLAIDQVQAGSSPRMRGKRAKARNEADNEGLIPAYAGKTRGGRRGL